MSSPMCGSCEFWHIDLDRERHDREAGIERDGPWRMGDCEIFGQTSERGTCLGSGYWRRRPPWIKKIRRRRA